MNNLLFESIEDVEKVVDGLFHIFSVGLPYLDNNYMYKEVNHNGFKISSNVLTARVNGVKETQKRAMIALLKDMENTQRMIDGKKQI